MAMVTAWSAASAVPVATMGWRTLSDDLAIAIHQAHSNLRATDIDAENRAASRRSCGHGLGAGATFGRLENCTLTVLIS